MSAADILSAVSDTAEAVPYGFIDEYTKSCVRKAIFKAVCIPGYQVPYVSEELPIARGFGTGGLQITLSVVGPGDVVKIIDEGDDDTVNAVNLRRFVASVTGNETTTRTGEASVIQSRHRVPEVPLDDDQILVLQAAFPCPLRFYERNDAQTRRMHAERDYGKLWLRLYESVVQFGAIMVGTRYPVLVNGRYAMDPTPIPRWDLCKLNMSRALTIFCAGREKRIYAVPPRTRVEPLAFDDHPFATERFEATCCAKCGSTDTYLVPLIADDGSRRFVCSDTSLCAERAAARAGSEGR